MDGTQFGDSVTTQATTGGSVLPYVESYLYDDPTMLSRIGTDDMFALSSVGLSSWYKTYKFTQFRLYCSKPDGRTVHFTTTTNEQGIRGFNRLIFKNLTAPTDGCTSFNKLKGDNSIIMGNCQKMIFGTSPLERPYLDPVWVWRAPQYHINLAWSGSPNRYECDDYVNRQPFTTNGTWKYFIR